jgi:hypothetical protein
VDVFGVTVSVPRDGGECDVVLRIPYAEVRRSFWARR